MTTTYVQLLVTARGVKDPAIKKRIVASALTLKQAGIIDTVKNVGGKLLDVQQFMLDMAGFVPVIGEIADGVNSMYSLLRGDFFGAVMSLISMIPEAGDAVGKGGKVLRFLTKMSENPGTLQKASKFLLEHGDTIKKVLNTFVSFVQENEQEIMEYVEGFKNLGEGKVNPDAPHPIKSLAAKAAKSEKLQEMAKKAAPQLGKAVQNVFSMAKNSGKTLQLVENAAAKQAKPAA